ncbi:hypothetical protein AD2_03003 [Acetivibrio thermocellus AD2]|nr:hypothetical protein AD2_03003 [Acetivibrio thermocellus AD2]ANV77755.1 hypothetical protein LQRI_3014 [Acetivibrio thermocellus DSM 2360]EIC03822.1 hypothetical protein YSBL_2463 [Acetivibrio thermocellus YS]
MQVDTITAIEQSFYRTYEELKLLTISENELESQARFYRTYEELKQFGGTKLSDPSILVFIVPMRN